MNKKLFLISAIACCCSLSSCDMDLTPETNIATTERTGSSHFRLW